MNNKLLVLGTMAYDAIETPFGKTGRILGGCATYIGLAASHFKTQCGLISIIGGDFESKYLDLLKEKKLDLKGVVQLKEEKTFFWSGKYHNDLNTRTTLETQLNVLTKFNPEVPSKFKDARVVLLGNLDPNIQLEVLNQMTTRPDLVIMDTMNFWIESYREKLDQLIARVDVISINDEEARQLTQKYSLVEAAQELMAQGPRYVIIKKENMVRSYFMAMIFFVPQDFLLKRSLILQEQAIALSVGLLLFWFNKKKLALRK